MQRVIEICAVFAVGLLVVCLLVAYLAFTFGQSQVVTYDGTIKIEARGREFEWDFRYPGRDQKLGTSDDVRSRHELHVPMGADVQLVLESDDYIYTFSSPEMGVKEMAVPELQLPLQFRAAQTGVFDLPSDPMCGMRYFHGENMGRITIESADVFEQWLDSQLQN